MSVVPEKTTQEVTIAVHAKPACRIELEVKTPPSLVGSARREAIKKINKEVTFPGFRKGRAPEEMVLKKYGAAVENEWHKAIADEAFAAAQMQARVPVLNNNSQITFNLKKHSLEEGAELTFSFETEPHIPGVDPKYFIATPVKQVEVGEKEINEAIRQMMFFYAEWKPVQDRGVQAGDYILIDLDTVDGEPQRVFNHIRFEVSPERMANWMRQLVFGAKSGSVLDGISEADDSLTEEEKKEFKPKKVRLTIHKIEEAKLPELNDEFANKVGAKDVAMLRESVTKILEQNAKDKVKNELREQVNDFLINHFPFELPLSLIQTEKDHRMKQIHHDPKFRTEWEKMSADERKRAEEKIYTESSQAVRLFYLSRQIVRQAEVPITHQEVQDEAIQSANAFGRKVDPDHLPKEIYALALSKIILAKAQDHILANAPKTTS